jgi:hypothetical protein
MLFCSFSDSLHVFKEAFKALAAGGVLEMQDAIFDFRSPDDSLSLKGTKNLKEAFGLRGIDLTCVSNYRNYLEMWDLRIFNAQPSPPLCIHLRLPFQTLIA